LTGIQNTGIHKYRFEWNRNYYQHSSSSSSSSIISGCHAQYDTNYHDNDDELKKAIIGNSKFFTVNKIPTNKYIHI